MTRGHAPLPDSNEKISSNDKIQKMQELIYKNKQKLKEQTNNNTSTTKTLNTINLQKQINKLPNTIAELVKYKFTSYRIMCDYDKNFQSQNKDKKSAEYQNFKNDYLTLKNAIDEKIITLEINKEQEIIKQQKEQEEQKQRKKQDFIRQQIEQEKIAKRKMQEQKIKEFTDNLPDGYIDLLSLESKYDRLLRETEDMKDSFFYSFKSEEHKQRIKDEIIKLTNFCIVIDRKIEKHQGSLAQLINGFRSLSTTEKILYGAAAIATGGAIL